MAPRPAQTAKLVFNGGSTGPETRIREDISCIAASDNSVFVACDETAAVEQLIFQGRDYGDHRRIAMADFFDLPAGRTGEMDIEGLAADDGWLWVTGSHSLKRDKPKRDGHGAAESLERMMEIDRDPNRYFLARIPIVSSPDSERLTRKDGKRRAASLKLKKKKSQLLKWLKDDEHLRDFLAIPSKENGFDIEGIAASGNRIWLGLRGPVLRGHGVILEMKMKVTKKGQLKPKKLEDGKRYRKHLLDTQGLGIRDLCRDGHDLLVLVGTPLASDGPARVLRWTNATSDTVGGVVDPGRIEPVLELPYRADTDHPEGIELVARDGRRRLAVVYDSPAARRVGQDPPHLKADLFALG